MLASLRSRAERLFPHGVWDVVLQVALFQVIYMAYRFTRGAIDSPQGAAVAFEHGRAIIDFERSTGLFIEPKLQSAIGATGFVADVASWIYLNAQVTITVGCLIYIYLRHNGSFYFVRNMFIVAWAIALLGYVIYPTAPPRLFPEWGFVDSVADFTGIPTDSGAAGALFNPYAAVPSMHVAFALMISMPLALLAKHRVTRVLWCCYPLIVTFVIVMTGNHFITDAILGALTAATAAVAATWLGSLREHWAFEGRRAALAPAEREPVRVPA